MGVRTRSVLSFLGLALAMAAVPVQATQVEYRFTSDSTWDFGQGHVQGSFTYVANSFLAAAQTIPVGDLASCTVSVPAGGSCGSIAVFNPHAAGVLATYDYVGFYVNGNALGFGYYYAFPDGAFGQVGDYVSNLDGNGTNPRGRLSVSLVPEPETYAQLVAGLATLGFVVRRSR
jgi:hypothetical protein